MLIPAGQGFFKIPGGDKAGHLFLMGTLSFLVNISLSTCRIRLMGIQVSP
jgi:hypothetical protein